LAKQTYRLQPVLEKRQREKDQAVQKVAEAKKQVEYEQKKLEKIIEMRMQVDEKKKLCTQRFYEQLEKAGTNVAEESTSHDLYQKVLDVEARNHDEAIVRQKIVIEEAKDKVKQAEAALLQATINVQAMEKHKEDWEKQVKREELEKEQELGEELGEAMWLQQRRKAAQSEAE
jgi:hypothetical protein